MPLHSGCHGFCFLVCFEQQNTTHMIENSFFDQLYQCNPRFFNSIYRIKDAVSESTIKDTIEQKLTKL